MLEPCDFDVVGRDVESLTINASCVSYDPQADVVTTLVTWQLPASSTDTATKTGRATWNSTILVQYQTPEGPHLNAYRAAVHYIQLPLAVDYEYEITVRYRVADVIYHLRRSSISTIIHMP